MTNSRKEEIGRRTFLGAAVGAGLTILKPQLVRGTAANSAIRMGVLGCGGRAMQVVPGFIKNTSARIVALGDLFEDQLVAFKNAIDDLQKAKGYAGIEPSQLFKGAKAFEEIAASKEIDAVLITTPPYYHPDHLEAVVEASKHVYVEKPVAVDVSGAKRVIRIGEKAKGRLSLDVGFQIRSAPPYVEMVRRIHNGALGEIVCGDAHSCFPSLDIPPRPYASPDEQRIRTWFYDRVLSGDILVEQNIHALDVCNWILQGHPLKAVGAGGRKTSKHPGEDNLDHFNITYWYAGGVHVSFSTTKFDRGWWDVSERFFGTKGISESHYVGGMRIYGDEPWDTGFGGQGRFWHGMDADIYADALKDAESEKQKAFVQSILTGNFHNQAALGAESTLSAILGRTAVYENREVHWDDLIRSDERWESGIDLNKLAQLS
jgi:predicted dehydrogenase